MNKDVKAIQDAMDLVLTACDNIIGKERCSDCPIFGTCIMQETFEEVAAEVSASAWFNFLNLSDECLNYISDEDAEALHWDDVRKAEIEERMIDEEWGI